ncbi:MAG: SPOR domain-containing protein [Anaerovoracaceae bacterium]
MFLGIMVLAVLCGYLTARFIVGPMIGYDADESPARIAGDSGKDSDKESDKASEKTEAEQAGAAQSAEPDEEDGSVPTEGFALQFGAFSTREAAEKLAASLNSQGISAEIVKADDVFKVISPVVDTKEKALNELESLSEKDVEDVFVASFG